LPAIVPDQCRLAFFFYTLRSQTPEARVEKMSTWFKPNCKTSCCASSGPTAERDLVTTHFTYDATTIPYPNDTITFAELQGIDQIVIEGTIPAPNTVVYMPPHTALLDLFTNPKVDDQFAFDVSNTGANSIDLTIYKSNAEPTGSALVAYTNPLRIATIPAASVVRLYLRVIDATPITTQADVKMLTTLEGGTGSLALPSINFDLSLQSPVVNAVALKGQQIIPSVIGTTYQYLFLNGAVNATVAPSVPNVGDNPMQLLYPNGLTTAPLLISPIAAGDVFAFTAFSNNQSGQTITWGTGGITGVSIAGVSCPTTGRVPGIQPTSTIYEVTFTFTIAGLSSTSPPWAGTTLVINLNQVSEPAPNYSSVFVTNPNNTTGTRTMGITTVATTGLKAFYHSGLTARTDFMTAATNASNEAVTNTYIADQHITNTKALVILEEVSTTAGTGTNPGGRLYGDWQYSTATPQYVVKTTGVPTTTLPTLVSGQMGFVMVGTAYANLTNTAPAAISTIAAVPIGLYLATYTITATGGAANVVTTSFGIAPTTTVLNAGSSPNAPMLWNYVNLTTDGRCNTAIIAVRTAQDMVVVGQTSVGALTVLGQFTMTRIA